MLAKILDVDYDESSRLLVDAKMGVAMAIVMHQTNCSYDTANETLDKVHGKVREAILNINK